MPNIRGVLIRLVVGCLVIGGTAYQVWRYEQRTTILQSSEDRLRRQFSSLEHSIAEVRAGQAGYVAAGQGAEFWMGLVDEAVAQIDGLLSGLEQDDPGSDRLAAARKELAAFQTTDGRARNYVNNNQLLLASDVIFVQSLEVLSRLSMELATLRDTQLMATTQEAATIRQYELALGGAALLVLLVLSMVGAKAATPEPRAVAEATSEPVASVTDKPAAEGTSVAPPLDVEGAAGVCVDLARLLDARDLPPLLARAASAIGARGLVLWVVDEAGQTLHPSLAHGYSERTVQRLGTLSVTADNVTSAACRTLKARTVPASDPAGSGALAVPLIGSSGCVGVLAVEVVGPAANGSTLPLARLVAAQLATVVTPVRSVAAQAEPAAEAQGI
jgi:hypothetical protein